MRLILLFLLLFGIGVHLAQEGPWFRDIKAPLSCQESALLSFTSQLREGLLAHKPSKELLALAPVTDASPRVLFLTLGDGRFPGRTYYAAGKNFQDALSFLLTIVEKREPEYAAAIKADLEGQVSQAQEEKRQLSGVVKIKLDNPNAWDSLRLDIVQAVLPINNYVVNSSRLLLSSVVGIAFDQTAAFAFPPEQLTGRYLLTDERQLSVTRVNNLIAEANLWSSMNLWMQMGASSVPFKVTLFESDSYFADEKGVRRLFRAHPARTVRQPDASSLRPLKEKLVTLATANAGTIAPPFPEWFASRADGQTSMFDQAALLYTLTHALYYGQGSGANNRSYTAIQNTARVLLRSLKHLDAMEKTENGQLVATERRKSNERTFALIVENEDLGDDNELEMPARISDLKTNALAYLAFQRAVQVLPADDITALLCRRNLHQLFRHISTQMNARGNYLPEVLYPTRLPKPTLGEEPSPDPDEALETAALVGLALEAHRLEFPENTPKQLKDDLTTLRNALGEKTMASLGDAPFSPWLAMFLAQDATKENPQRLAQLLRLALAAEAGLELSPMLPDMFGADADIPSMTYAAERLATIAIATTVLARNERIDDAKAILQDAWPLWVFQQQANMDAAAAAVLPRPDQYLDFQRDNLADYGFTLNGQTTQFMAQHFLLQALSSLEIIDFQPTEEKRQAWERCWEKLDHRPLCLSKDLVLKGTPGAENKRALAGSLQDPTVKTFEVTDANLTIMPGKAGSEHMEAKVLDRKPAKKAKKR